MGSLALLYFLLGFHGGRQGSGPDRGKSPVEWGDFPSVWLAGWLGLRPGWMVRGGCTDKRTDVRKISPFYRTSSPIGAAALPPHMKTKEKVEQG